MNQKMKLMFLGIALIAILAGASLFYQKQSQTVEQPQAQETENTIPAIDFNVQNQDGKNIYLSDFYDGKPIIINFWTSTCPPCRQEMPDYQSLYDRYENNVHFVMVNCTGALGETKDNAKLFLEQQGYTFPVYYDVNQNALNAYGIMSFPTTIIINQEQEIVAGGTGMIDEKTVENIFEKLLNE